MRDIVLVSVVGRARDALLERSERLLLQCEGGEPARRVARWSHPEAGLALLQVTSVESPPGPAPMAIGASDALAFSGWVSAPDSTAAAWIHRRLSWGPLERLLGGTPRLDESPGGIAAFFLARAAARSGFAWSSHAGVEGVFYTRGPECIAISNRPLLSHLVANQRLEPRYSTRWLRRVLIGNATLWDDTPFEGTLQVPPGSMLIVQRGEIRWGRHPVRLDGQRYEPGDPRGVAALNQAALAAVQVLRRWPTAELQLSGGKDSRYVAALVARAGIDVDLVTHAGVSSGEGEAASAVAAALGLSTRLTQASGIATGAELLPTMIANLRRTDGLLSENRQLSYRQPADQRPLVQGQAHHPRGGYAVPVDRSRNRTAGRLYWKLMADQRLVIDELVRERRVRLHEILGGYRVRQPVELAYWMYADWRMSRWTIASYMTHARVRPVVWPMMDERVLQVIAALAPEDRARETAFFAALRALSPAVADLPLYEDTWVFDRADGPSRFPAGAERRRQPFRERSAGRTADRRFSTIQALFRAAVHEMKAADELRRCIAPHVLEHLTTAPDPAQALGLSHRQGIEFMWKVAALALVHEGI